MPFYLKVSANNANKKYRKFIVRDIKLINLHQIKSVLGMDPMQQNVKYSLSTDMQASSTNYANQFSEEQFFKALSVMKIGEGETIRVKISIKKNGSQLESVNTYPEGLTFLQNKQQDTEMPSLIKNRSKSQQFASTLQPLSIDITQEFMCNSLIHQTVPKTKEIIRVERQIEKIQQRLRKNQQRKRKTDIAALYKFIGAE